MRKITILVILLLLLTMMTGCSNSETVDKPKDTVENTPNNVITNVLYEADEWALVIDGESMKQIKVNNGKYFSINDTIERKKQEEISYILVNKKANKSDKDDGIEDIVTYTKDYYIGKVLGAADGQVKVQLNDEEKYIDNDGINNSPIEMEPGDYLFGAGSELVIVRYSK